MSKPIRSTMALQMHVIVVTDHEMAETAEILIC